MPIAATPTNRSGSRNGTILGPPPPPPKKDYIRGFMLGYLSIRNLSTISPYKAARGMTRRMRRSKYSTKPRSIKLTVIAAPAAARMRPCTRIMNRPAKLAKARVQRRVQLLPLDIRVCICAVPQGRRVVIMTEY